jgi:hypothetical protein
MAPAPSPKASGGFGRMLLCKQHALDSPRLEDRQELLAAKGLYLAFSLRVLITNNFKQIRDVTICLGIAQNVPLSLPYSSR